MKVKRWVEFVAHVANIDSPTHPLLLLQAAWLDKVDRRYAWLKRLLLNISTNCPDIFPPSWGVPERIAINFCSQTKFVMNPYSDVLYIRSNFGKFE